MPADSAFYCHGQDHNSYTDPIFPIPQVSCCQDLEMLWNLYLQLERKEGNCKGCQYQMLKESEQCCRSPAPTLSAEEDCGGATGPIEGKHLAEALCCALAGAVTL